MDELSISEIVLLVSADMRANGVTFEEAFDKATEDYWLGKSERDSLCTIVRSRIN